MVRRDVECGAWSPNAKIERETLLFARSILIPFIMGLGLLSSTAARADLKMTARGSVAFLESSHLDRGDEDTFAQFLASPEASAVKIVYLDSRGGNTGAAIAIGKMIREHGLDTGFHVDHGRCVSACTTIFRGGVQRYYVGGDHVADGVATHIGLGFHPSNGNQDNEERIAAYYSEMGVPGASQVRYKIYSRSIVGKGGEKAESGAPQKYKIFFISGNLALKTGVATSISEPGEPALRDSP
jgi:hypothetical protein